jgi:hypothetical protein
MPSFVLEGNLRKVLISAIECVFNDFLSLLFAFSSFSLYRVATTLKVTIFLCSGWVIIIFTIFPLYLMLMISDDRHVMTVCWFKRIEIRAEWERNFDKDYYWFEVQILLTTFLTIFLPISMIVACNIRVLTIGESLSFPLLRLRLFINSSKVKLTFVAKRRFVKQSTSLCHKISNLSINNTSIKSIRREAMRKRFELEIYKNKGCENFKWSGKERKSSQIHLTKFSISTKMNIQKVTSIFRL